jgi:hypothetical protein
LNGNPRRVSPFREHRSRARQADQDRLLASGWSEDAIVAATHVVGVFNYLVRLADAFGIEWEPEVQASATHQPELWKD